MKRIISIFVIVYIYFFSYGGNVGTWQKDENGMPLFNYTGDYPFITHSKVGTVVSEDDDPFFILGNYRLTLFAHASGNIEVITGERSWARTNQGDIKSSGENIVNLVINGNSFQLTGKGSIAEKNDHIDIFAGTGFIKYIYQIDGIECIRSLSTKPSVAPNTGTPGYLTTIKLTNSKKETVKISFQELIRANYELMWQQRSQKLVDYVPLQNEKSNQQTSIIDFKATTDIPYLWTSKNEPAVYDGFPPSVFIHKLSKAIKAGTVIKDPKHVYLSIDSDISLKAGETIDLAWLTGIVYNNTEEELNMLIKELQPQSTSNGLAYRKEWKNVLPSFAKEKNDSLRRELIYHAYVLECMSTYSDYFKETKIPQGTRYDYQWGIQSSVRDHLQQIIPLFYYNPELGKSGMRYVMKKMLMNGDLKKDEIGMGVNTARHYIQSDTQLYFFWALAEYLRITGDYSFLLEQINYYPMNNISKSDFLERLKVAFNYLVIEVGKGPHGLIRLLNSDWDDSIYYIYKEEPYNRSYAVAESNVNTGMALVVFKELTKELRIAKSKLKPDKTQKELDWLITAFDSYRSSLLPPYLLELKDRDYLRWVHLIGGQSFGENEIYLLPQAYALQLDEIPVDKKKAINEEVSIRLKEKLGYRMREFSTPESYNLPGMGENGAFWWVTNAQYILGVSTFDVEAARQLYKKQTFGNYAATYPDYWIGYWSANDNVISSLSYREGQANAIPMCALPHSYNLYLWFKLFGESK